MTREEKEQTAKYVLQMTRLLEDGCYQQEMLLKAVHIIDETLEQESIFEKIRKEISVVYEDLDSYDPDSLGRFFYKTNKIIDKYKADSEG